MGAITRLSLDIGEKTTLASTQPIIAECLASGEWVKRYAGYMLFGLIAEPCADSLKKNLDEAIKTASKGIQDENARVRYTSLIAMAMLFANLGPAVQYKYHAELMPVLIKLMLEEPLVKMQAQATSAMLNFVTGLTNEDEDEKDESKNVVSPQELMKNYSKGLLQALVVLLKKGIQEKYEPLTTEVLALISTVAHVITSDFAEYYNDFMPLMTEILTNVGTKTMSEKNLRAKAIDSIGSMIIAVSDSENADKFHGSVVEVTQHLTNLLKGKLEDDDPQDEAIKDTLT